MLQIASYKDFAMGAAATLAAVFFYHVRAFLHVEPCAKIQQKAKAPIQLRGDPTTITVWGFQHKGKYPAHAKGVCDGSPYVARVECYLRLLGVDYTKEISVDLSENPRTKLPFANIRGEMIDDSSRILRAVQKTLDIDEAKGLNGEQLRNGHFLRRLLTGNLYWVRYSMNFETEVGRHAVVDELKKANIPSLLIPFISAMVIKAQHANLFGQGSARMPLEEVIEMGKADLRAITALLGDNTYILGTSEATVFDTDLYAFLSHLFYDTTPSSMEWVQDIKKELPKLEHFTERMRSRLFPELKTKTI